MNWYKKAQTWEEIKRYGPSNEPNADLSLAIEYLQKIYPGLTDEELKIKAKRDGIGVGEYSRRSGFISQYGWSVPSEKGIEKLKEFVGNEKVIEVGAGYGLWAKLMQDADIQIVPTDMPLEREDRSQVPKDHAYTDIERLNNLDAMQKYIDFGVLMMVWPPYNDPMAYETLKKFKGNKLIFVGEGARGCTGCDKFFDLLGKNWKEVETVFLPQWHGIHDGLQLYVRK